MIVAISVVLASAAGAMLLSWGYFRRYQVMRPPIGVITLGDVVIMLIAIILVPFLYLGLPRWLVAALLALATLSVLSVLFQPVLRGRLAPWTLTLGLVGADIGTALLLGTTSPVFLAINNLVLVLVVVGITNLWAQSGMKARDAAVLGGSLAIYDVTATTLLPLMTDLISRLTSIPLLPLVAWTVDQDGNWLGLGLGDLLLLTVFPLVLRKAFGQTAGLAAVVVGLGTVALVLVVLALGLLRVAFPVMVVLGPLMVLQYVVWRRRGAERTTWQYRQAELGEAAR